VRSRIIRTFGIASALLLSIAGLALVSGSAGATTQSTVNLKASFTFTTAAGVNKVNCPTGATYPGKKLVTVKAVKIASSVSTQQVQCKVVTGGPTHTGIPKTSTVKLLIMGKNNHPTKWTWLSYTTTPNRKGTILAGTLQIKIKFGTGATCKVAFPNAIPVKINAGLTKALITPAVATKTAVVTGAAAPCVALSTLLGTAASKFSGSISGI
jgi:hypothetical protein